MSGAVPSTGPQQPVPEFSQIMGHPKPLWMLFMSEFWERFAFYGIRWALVLYIVAQFYGGDASGEQPAGFIYGAYLALVYATAIFGGYDTARYVHFVMMASIVGFLVIHVALALIVPKSLRAMIIGR